MQIKNHSFGKTAQGEKVELYTLTNNSGAFVKITNYGGIITDIHVPDKNGKLTNVVLGFDRVEVYYSEDYKKLMPYFGAIIGRYANRIAKGKFEIKGVTYSVPCNLGSNALHGGSVGFDKKVWQASAKKSEEKAVLELTYISPHLEEGFPGKLDVKVIYTWDDQNELGIEYFATTDRQTHLNFTNHSYFNLNGCNRDVLDHELIIHADYFTEVDAEAIPTGHLKEVDLECMDFRTAHKIGERIEKAQGNGYDHNYVIIGYDGTLKHAATVRDASSGIKMEVLTTEPGVQLFTANHLDNTLKRGSAVFSKRMGFCLETQHFADTPNQPSFPSTLLEPGKVFHSMTRYKFLTEK